MDRSVANVTNYDPLMTPQERSALRQLSLLAKVKYTDSPAIKKVLMEKWGNNDPEIAALVEMGWEPFLQMVHDRILREYPDEVNRCPKCKKLTATVKAKQCFACGHDWHDVV